MNENRQRVVESDTAPSVEVPTKRHFKLPETPFLAADAVIYYPAPEPGDIKIVVIERKNPPYGLALPGGFVERDETVEAACLRETLEEVSLRVEIVRLLGVYSGPNRDPRMPVTSIAFLCTPTYPNQPPVAADDAKTVRMVTLRECAQLTWAFDHQRIVLDAASILYNK